MLDKLERLIDDHPPLTTSQRFGNLAFRTWSTAMLSVRRFALLQSTRDP